MRGRKQCFLHCYNTSFLKVNTVPIVILIPVNKNLKLNLLMNFEVWNQNDALTVLSNREVNSKKLITMQNFDLIKVALSVTMVTGSVFSLGFNLPLTTKDRITCKQKYTGLDETEYGGSSTFKVWVIILVATHVLLYN